MFITINAIEVSRKVGLTCFIVPVKDLNTLKIKSLKSKLYVKNKIIQAIIIFGSINSNLQETLASSYNKKYLFDP